MNTSKKNIPNSLNFDWKYYLSKYPDLRKNKIKTKERALEHYLTRGVKEKRFSNIEDEIKSQLKMGKNENEKIVVASTQWPGYGGSATNAYNIIKFLRSMGYKTAGIFFENNDCEIDPDEIKGIWRIDRKLKNYVEHFGDIINYLGGVPNFCLGKNYVAPILLKKMFPTGKNYYLVSGSIHMTYLAKYGISANLFLKNKIEKYDHIFNEKKIKKTINYELECFKASDLVIPNSEISLKILQKIYKKQKNKIKFYIDVTLATAATSNKNYGKKKSEKRDNDIIFVVSNVLRNVKNSDFVRKLFVNEKLKKYKKIVVGKNSEIFEDCATAIGFTKNNIIKKLLANSKLIILPSYFDANPNVIQEAIYQNCLPLLSKNVGGAERFDDHFVCDDIYNEELWVEKIQYLVNNFDYFIKNIEEKKLWINKYEIVRNINLLKNILKNEKYEINQVPKKNIKSLNIEKNI